MTRARTPRLSLADESLRARPAPTMLPHGSGAGLSNKGILLLTDFSSPPNPSSIGGGECLLFLFFSKHRIFFFYFLYVGLPFLPWRKGSGDGGGWRLSEEKS